MNIKICLTPGLIWIASLAFLQTPYGDRHQYLPISKTKKMITDTSQKPSIVIERKIVDPMPILYIKDTATMGTLSTAISAGYSELFEYIRKKGLMAKRVMAFYYNYQDPIQLDIAVEVDKLPDVTTGRIQARTVEGGDAVIAHYTGPYEQLQLPYNEITQWLKENKEQPKGLPFEVYLNDPASVKDKYELKTDIYQLLK